MLDSHEASTFEVSVDHCPLESLYSGEVERDSGEYFMDNKLVASQLFQKIIFALNMKISNQNISNFSPNKKPFFLVGLEQLFGFFPCQKRGVFLKKRQPDNPKLRRLCTRMSCDLEMVLKELKRLNSVSWVSFEGRKVQFEQCKKGPRLFRVYFCRG